MADEVGIFQVTKRIHDIIAQWSELISEGEAYRSCFIKAQSFLIHTNGSLFFISCR